jgi:hypothetical protein
MSYVLISLVTLIASSLLRLRSDRRRRPDHRIGFLGAGGLPMDARTCDSCRHTEAAARRAAQLVRLGDPGTYRVYNCGRILHVDYERGELIVERGRCGQEQP